MTKTDFWKIACVHNAKQDGLLAIVGWVSAYTISLLIARIISAVYMDGSFETLMATFVVLATGLNLVLRNSCDGPRRLWYMVCVFAMVFVGLYLSGEALRVQQLQQHAERMDQRVAEMVSNCPGAVFATTQAGKIRAANKGACELTGYSRNELVGASLQVIMDSATAENRIAWRQNSAVEMHEKENPGWVVSAADVPIRKKDGTVFTVKIYSFGLRHSVFGQFPDDIQFVSIFTQN